MSAPETTARKRKAPATPMTSTYAQTRDLLARYGIDRATLVKRWRKLSDDPFPAPIQFGGSTNFYAWADVLAWEQRRAINGSRPHAAAGASPA